MDSPNDEDLASKWWNNYELKTRDDVKDMVAYYEETARLKAEEDLSSRVIDRMGSVGSIVGSVVGVSLWVLLIVTLIVLDPDIPFLLGVVLILGGFIGLPMISGVGLGWFGEWCGRHLVRPTGRR